MVTLARLIGLGLGFALGMILHEFAHALLSDRLGDKTPRLAGRLTLRPGPHIDPIGTIAMPAIFALVSLAGRPFGMIFGYAKPVPTTPRMLRKPRRDQVIVALAGPGANLAVAAIAGYAARAIAPPGGTLASVVRLFVAGGSNGRDVVVVALMIVTTINAYLTIINALPIPPLDGSKVLNLFLSPQAQFKMVEWSQYLLLFLIVLFFVFRGVLGAMADPVCRAFTDFPKCVL